MGCRLKCGILGLVMVYRSGSVMKERITRNLLWIIGVGCSVFFLNRFVFHPIVPLDQAALNELDRQVKEAYRLRHKQEPNDFIEGKGDTITGADFIAPEGLPEKSSIVPGGER